MLDVEFRHWLGIVQNCNNNWGCIKLKCLPFFFLKKKKKKKRLKKGKKRLLLVLCFSGTMPFFCSIVVCTFFMYLFLLHCLFTLVWKVGVCAVDRHGNFVLWLCTGYILPRVHGEGWLGGGGGMGCLSGVPTHGQWSEVRTPLTGLWS